MTKPSNVRAATAWNINNMNMGPILRHAALYPLHPGIKFSPWKCVNFANTSLPTLYYEISGCFRIGQNFHISAHFHHFATLVKCISGYRLQLLISSLTIFWRYTGAIWKIRKVLQNPNYPLKNTWRIKLRLDFPPPTYQLFLNFRISQYVYFCNDFFLTITLFLKKMLTQPLCRKIW